MISFVLSPQPSEQSTKYWSIIFIIAGLQELVESRKFLPSRHLSMKTQAAHIKIYENLFVHAIYNCLSYCP